MNRFFIVCFLVAICQVTGQAKAAKQSPYQPFIKKIQKRLKNNPKDHRLHTVLGRLYQKSGDLKKAQRHYRKALRISPDFLHAKVGMAHVYLKRNRWKKARSILRRLLKKYKKQPPASVLEKMSELHRLYALRAKARSKKQRYHFVTSILYLEQAIKASPKRHRYRYKAGLLYLATRDYIKAHLHFVTAVSQLPYHPCYRLGLYLSKSFIGQKYQESLNKLEHWLPRCSHPLLFSMATRMHMTLAVQLANQKSQKGKKKAAIKVLQDALKKNPKMPSGHMFLLLLLYETNRCAEARKVLQTLLKLNPKHKFSKDLLRNPKFKNCFSKKRHRPKVKAKRDLKQTKR